MFGCYKRLKVILGPSWPRIWCCAPRQWEQFVCFMTLSHQIMITWHQSLICVDVYTAATVSSECDTVTDVGGKGGPRCGTQEANKIYLTKHKRQEQKTRLSWISIILNSETKQNKTRQDYGDNEAKPDLTEREPWEERWGFSNEWGKPGN